MRTACAKVLGSERTRWSEGLKETRIAGRGKVEVRERKKECVCVERRRSWGSTVQTKAGEVTARAHGLAATWGAPSLTEEQWASWEGGRQE